MRQLFFIEGRLLGEANRTKQFVHAELHDPMSGLWFCGFCGEVYARAPILLPNGSQCAWQSYRAVCRKCAPRSHPSMFQVPGSIWLSWDHDFLAALPGAVLQWELQRHLDQAERIHI